jgi:riboflavin synthase
MFTGIVEAIGEVVDVEATDGGHRLRIAAPFVDDLDPGGSVSVDGACLTVETIEDGEFTVFLAAETRERTALGRLEPGGHVNLERSMPADGRFDGHLVQGHVDTVTEVTAVDRVGDDWWFEFALPDDHARYVVSKGPVALDGISLTVAERGADRFGIAIIPTTYDLTNLSEKSVGDPVHLEVDVIAKYVESLLEGHSET